MSEALTLKQPFRQAEHTFLVKGTFENQFSNPQRIESQGAVVEFVRLRPEILSDQVPIIVGGGLGLEPRAYQSIARQIYNKGREVILVKQPRSGRANTTNRELVGADNKFRVDTLVATSNNNDREVISDQSSSDDLLEGGTTDKLPDSVTANIEDLLSAGIDRADIAEQVQKARNTIAVLKACGIEKTDVIAHSEGTLFMTIAALERPDLFRSMVFMGPAGMIGKDTFPRLALRFAKVIGHNITKNLIENPATGITINNSALKYGIKNPAKSLREVFETAKTRIDKLLYEARENGTKIGVLYWDQDLLFPANRIRGNVTLDSQGFRGNVDTHDYVYQVGAGHDDLRTNAATNAKAALDMLRKLNVQES